MGKFFMGFLVGAILTAHAIQSEKAREAKESNYYAKREKMDKDNEDKE